MSFINFFFYSSFRKIAIFLFLQWETVYFAPFCPFLSFEISMTMILNSNMNRTLLFFSAVKVDIESVNSRSNDKPT